MERFAPREPSFGLTRTQDWQFAALLEAINLLASATVTYEAAAELGRSMAPAAEEAARRAVGTTPLVLETFDQGAAFVKECDSVADTVFVR